MPRAAPSVVVEAPRSDARQWQYRSPQLEEPGPVDRVTPAGHAKLAVEGPLVGLDRVHRQIEISRNLRGRQGAGEVAQHGALPLGEWVDRLVSGPGGGRRHVGHPLEHVERELRYAAALFDPALEQGPQRLGL